MDFLTALHRKRALKIAEDIFDMISLLLLAAVIVLLIVIHLSGGSYRSLCLVIIFLGSSYLGSLLSGLCRRKRHRI